MLVSGKNSAFCGAAFVRWSWSWFQRSSGELGIVKCQTLTITSQGLPPLISR
jgi:hypothetical protein